jgi:hypothetical protein
MYLETLYYLSHRVNQTAVGGDGKTNKLKTSFSMVCTLLKLFLLRKNIFLNIEYV